MLGIVSYDDDDTRLTAPANLRGLNLSLLRRVVVKLDILVPPASSFRSFPDEDPWMSRAQRHVFVCYLNKYSFMLGSKLSISPPNMHDIHY